MYKSPDDIRRTRELWFRVELGDADEVPRKVIAHGCMAARGKAEDEEAGGSFDDQQGLDCGCQCRGDSSDTVCKQ